VPIRTRIERTGFKQVDVIETKVGNLRVDFYLDRKTRLPIKLITDDYNGISEFTQRMGLTVWLDDYATIDGIKMPGRVAREPKVPTHMLRRDTEYARYKFNVAYEETIFDHPVSKKVKSSDWQPRRND
jgi:hypothetical protein